jgi:release factor glutamine methyltransferase
MYIPSDDSFLLSETAKQYNGRSALEIGVGSGIIASVLCEHFNIVVCTDIFFQSLRYCKYTLPKNVKIICCDAASAIHIKFDLIVSNPPYLPYDQENKNNDSAVYGGPSGIETTLHFLKSTVGLLDRNGRILIVLSTLSTQSKLDDLLVEMNLEKKTIKERKIFYETLSVVEIHFK